jgi:uncharacterized protein (DUF849 family)
MLETPLIINVAPTGAVADHSKNPHVPIEVDTIVESIAASAAKGASICHVHVRDAQGMPASDAAQFAEIFSRLRANGQTRDLVLCATTSGRHGQTLEQRAAVLQLPTHTRPDLASLTLGSLNFSSGPSINAHDTIRSLADAMRAGGVKPELEIFDLGMIEFAKQLISEGRLTPPYYFNIFLGNIGGIACDVRQLGFVLGTIPQPAIVSVAGIGRHQFAANALGIVTANGVRVGLEDNLWQDRARTSLASNAGLVERVVSIARTLERPIATPNDAREMLGLDARVCA